MKKTTTGIAIFCILAVLGLLGAGVIANQAKPANNENLTVAAPTSDSEEVSNATTTQALKVNQEEVEIGSRLELSLEDLGIEPTNEIASCIEDQGFDPSTDRWDSDLESNLVFTRAFTNCLGDELTAVVAPTYEPSPGVEINDDSVIECVLSESYSWYGELTIEQLRNINTEEHLGPELQSELVDLTQERCETTEQIAADIIEFSYPTPPDENEIATLFESSVRGKLVRPTQKIASCVEELGADTQAVFDDDLTAEVRAAINIAVERCIPDEIIDLRIKYFRQYDDEGVPQVDEEELKCVISQAVKRANERPMDEAIAARAYHPDNILTAEMRTEIISQSQDICELTEAQVAATLTASYGSPEN